MGRSGTGTVSCMQLAAIVGLYNCMVQCYSQFLIESVVFIVLYELCIWPWLIQPEHLQPRLYSVSVFVQLSPSPKLSCSKSQQILNGLHIVQGEQEC